MPSRPAFIARCLNMLERLQVPSVVKSKECLEKYSLLASLTILGSRLNALAWLDLSIVNKCGISCLLGLGGPPKVAFGVAPPIGMLSMGSGKGCCLLGLEDCISAAVGGTVAVGSFSMREVFCGEVSGGNGGACPSKRWYKWPEHALHGIWQRVLPFGLGRLFGCQCGWNSSSWLFLHEGGLLW